MSTEAKVILGWLILMWVAIFAGVMSAIMGSYLAIPLGIFIIVDFFGSVLAILLWITFKVWRAGSA
jgi:hypothetical protein